jgi:Bacteriophage Lambda NinG protein
MTKKKTKTIAQVVDAAATILQKLVRLKAANDSGLVQCVTCDKWAHWKDMQGGHFIARGSKQWKLVEENIHPQCPGCNGFGMKYGNAEAVYTGYMIDMYGREFVDHMLMTKSQPKKYTRVEVEELVIEWKDQIKHHEKRVV